MRELEPTDKLAMDQLEGVIQANRDVFGPRGTETSPDLAGDWHLTEWVLVAAWTRMEDGGVQMTRVTSVGLPSYRLVGMLHEAADYEWEDV